MRFPAGIALPKDRSRGVAHFVTEDNPNARSNQSPHSIAFSAAALGKRPRCRYSPSPFMRLPTKSSRNAWNLSHIHI